MHGGLPREAMPNPDCLGWSITADAPRDYITSGGSKNQNLFNPVGAPKGIEDALELALG